MENRRNVVKFKKRRGINIGAVIFLIILVYVIVTVYFYMTKPHLTIYEVHAGSTVDDNIVTGIILRKEEIIYTPVAGYINYYQKDGERIAKKSPLYSIDESRQMYELLSNNDEAIEYTASDVSAFRKEVSRFRKNFNTNQYSSVTDFKYDIENTLVEVIYENTMNNMQDILSEQGIVSNFQLNNSKKSGIVTYYIDGYENLSADDIKGSDFDQETYKKQQLRTSELVAENSPVCKMITSEKWSIILNLTQEQYESMLEKTKINFTILKDGFEVTAPVEVYQSGGEYFAKISMDKYMVQYLSDRFLEIEIRLNLAEGLKIPVSSITEKDFYLIPKDLFTKGADSDRDGLVKETYNENGDVEYEFVETEIYYDDGEYGYVDTRLFEYGNWVRSAATQERYQVRTIQQLKGVYNVNNGWAEFTKIDIIYENDEFAIVKDSTKNGLSVYDHIALIAETAVEQAIIY